MPLLRSRGVCKNFGTFRAVDRVSLDIGAGEFFALLGRAACGKTTLLRMLAASRRPTRPHPAWRPRYAPVLRTSGPST